MIVGRDEKNGIPLKGGIDCRGKSHWVDEETVGAGESEFEEKDWEMSEHSNVSHDASSVVWNGNVWDISVAVTTILPSN